VELVDASIRGVLPPELIETKKLPAIKTS